ncbi:AAA family ATPase [Candidatus Poribacteria bacterium]|nr:AAA family ATPase [Candidatus Poribacteria bacterium]
MKICKLKLKNLNSFRDPVEIDFEKSPLDDVSLVAITGPTGAGKTTLLDAICVALYGKTPRLSGTGSQNPNHLISHGEKEAFAEALFMANGTQYLATWSVKQNGSPKVQLFYGDGGKLISDKLSNKGKSLGSSQKTVSEEVESILGLDFDAFRRSVMLAQGDFAAFLKASMEDRRNILEATAGVSIYDVLKQILNEKVSEVEAANAEVYDKLNKIPEASREQVVDAETEISRLRTGADALGAESQQIQAKKDRETKRKAEFEKLQSSEKRQEALLGQQTEIDALELERRLAEKAQRLLPEKQAFDTAKSAFENSEESLHVAITEKTEAEAEVETAQAVYNEKDEAYQAASTERNQKMPVYTAAKSDVERAEGQLAEAKKRDPRLADLGDQIDTLENKLADRKMEQTDLQGQVDDVQRFLAGNPLPSDRQSRLTRVTGLRMELTAHEKQLETELKDKANAVKKVFSLKKEIEKLSKIQEEHLSGKALAETTLADADTQLKNLLATGTSEEWTARRQLTSKAQPIAREYEATQDDLAEAENRLNALNETAAALNAELGQIETDLASQSDICQQAAEVVKRCESEKEDAQWADPINQLRQRLQSGEPCSVCGATDHPCADVVEPESEERIQRAEEALAAAKAESAAAQAELQTLKTKQIQIRQNKSNAADQIEICRVEIETLRDETAERLTEWQAIYPDTDVSSAWVSEQFDIADTAITDIAEAKQTRTQADNSLQIVSQRLETCENNITRETNVLNDAEKQLERLKNTITDLQADIKATEERFWGSIPKTFHGTTPKEAVDQFEDKIEAVASREDELGRAETDIQVLNANIEADKSKLQGLKESHEALKNEKDEYMHEQEAFLTAAREKTGGLDTEDDINAAVAALEADLQAKENARDSAKHQLQNSQNLLTQKQTTHKMREEDFNKSTEKLDASREVYFNKLKKEGFDTPEAHNDAFRDDGQIQDLNDQINAHATETQQLALEITELQTRFEETPYDPDALEQIETQLGAIGTQLQEKQKEIGGQEERIKGLKDALEKREALGSELGAAQQEVKRWQRLQETIPANTLRDFALEIMFKQMGSLANEQLKYLTSERYQLKVEGIGNLSVVDRWNANQERPVETLSGGESFLTSLALALALSELSRGRSQLNSLFLDEGFGTLDTETLDIAIAALEGLRMQGRNIFLISHIRELTRRLPVKIEVNKKGNGSSSVRIQG